MTILNGRNTLLKNRINQHLYKLTGNDIDYYSRLKQNDLIELKTVLADINNVFTFKLTISAAKWICKYFNLGKEDKIKILKNVDKASPNSKGFDIDIKEPFKIIAEVKCVSPIKNGPKFGVAQHDSIMEDIHKLIYGKGNLVDTTNFFKFLFIIDLGDRSDKAIRQLIKETKGTTPKANKYNELKSDKILLLKDNMNINDLDTKKVYLKKLKID